MSSEDKTPPRPETMLELVFKRLDEIGADAKLAVTEAREAKQYASRAEGYAHATNNLQLELNEANKAVEERLAKLERLHFALPAASLALAALSLLVIYVLHH